MYLIMSGFHQDKFFFLGGDEEVFKNCKAWSTLWLFGGCGLLHFTLISEHQASVKLEYSWSYYVTSIDKFVIKQLGMQYPTYDVIIESISLERKLYRLLGRKLHVYTSCLCVWILFNLVCDTQPWRNCEIKSGSHLETRLDKFLAGGIQLWSPILVQAG